MNTNPTPTQQDETLLACPFCGSPTPQVRVQQDGVYIDCYRKGCSVEVLTDCETAEEAIKRWNTRAAVAGPRVDRALYSELIHIAAELARGEGFLPTCAEDMSPRLNRADILKTAERQDLQLKEWANRVRQVADRLSAAAVAGPRGNDLRQLHDVDCLYRTHNGKCDCSRGEVIELLATERALLKRLTTELELAVSQGYQPNLLDIAEAQRIAVATASPTGAESEGNPSVGKFIATIAAGLRHAIRDHGDITKEHIGSAAKRVWGRIRNTRYDPFRLDLDPLEFWCDLAEVLGHPRPRKVNPASLVAEVNERLVAPAESVEMRCGPARPDDGSECLYGVCPRPRDGCSEYCWQHHRSQCAPPERTPVEGEQIWTHLGELPLSLIDEIYERRLTVYKGFGYRTDPNIAGRMKTDLDYLMAFAIAFKPRPAAAPSDTAKLAAEEICAYFGDTALAMGGHVNANGVAAIISKYLAATPAVSDAESLRVSDISVWSAHGEWPLTDVLTALTYAVEHLLQDHDCDRHGYEQLSYAIPAAHWYVERLTATTKGDR